MPRFFVFKRMFPSPPKCRTQTVFVLFLAKKNQTTPDALDVKKKKKRKNMLGVRLWTIKGIEGRKKKEISKRGLIK